MPELVCCGIAVPAVAEQSNTRAAESVAVATGEACDCFRGLTLTLSSVLPLLLPLVLSLPRSALCWSLRRVASSHGLRWQLPSLRHSGHTCRRLCTGALVCLLVWCRRRAHVHDVLRNPAILHSAGMAEPA